MGSGPHLNMGAPSSMPVASSRYISASTSTSIDDVNRTSSDGGSSHVHLHCAAKTTDEKLSKLQLFERHLPPFRVWQAQQLGARDLLFAAFLLLTYLVYLRQTLPVLCSEGSHLVARNSDAMNGISDQIRNCSIALKSPDSAQKQMEPGNQQQWQMLWRIVCKPVPSNPVTPDARHFLSFLQHTLVLLVLPVLQGITAFFCCGWLTGDPFHVVIPPLRSAFVWMLLLPLPYLNATAVWQRLQQGRQDDSDSSSSAGSSEAVTCSGGKRSRPGGSRRVACYIGWFWPCHYWQNPPLRQAVIVLQRLLPPAVAAASVGRVSCRWFELTSLRYWPSYGQYIYLGWTAWMLMLPMRLQLCVSVIEWLLIFSTTLRVWAVYSPVVRESSAPVNWATLCSHLLVSSLCLLVLPNLGVSWLENSHRMRYRQLLGGREESSDDVEGPAGQGVAAGSSQQVHCHQQQQQPQDCSSSKVFKQAGGSGQSSLAGVGKVNNTGNKKSRQVVGNRFIDALAAAAAGAEAGAGAGAAAAADTGASSPAGEPHPRFSSCVTGFTGLQQVTQGKDAGMTNSSRELADAAGGSSEADMAAVDLGPFALQDHLSADDGEEDWHGAADLQADEQSALPICSTSSHRLLINSTSNTSIASLSELGSSSAPNPHVGSRVGMTGRASPAGPAAAAAAAAEPKGPSVASGSSKTRSTNSTSTQLMTDIRGSLQLAATAHLANSLSSPDLIAALPSCHTLQPRSTTPPAAPAAGSRAPAPVADRAQGMAGGQGMADDLAALLATVPSSTESSCPNGLARTANVQGLLDNIAPALNSLLGAEEAAAVFAAAAQAASGTMWNYGAAGGVPGIMPVYKSMAAALPISIKVHSEHHQLPALSPVLTDTLTSQLPAASTALAAQAVSGSSNARSSRQSGTWTLEGLSNTPPPQLHAVCFPGCVQLLAGIYSIRSAAAAAPAPAAAAAPAGAGRETAVCGGAAAAPAAGDHSELNLAGTDVAISGAVASDADAPMADGPGASGLTDGNTAASPAETALAESLLAAVHSQLNTPGHQAASQGAVPVDVMAGSATASSGDRTTSAGQAPPPGLTAKLLFCEPCCVVADSNKQQHLKLHLDISSSSGSSDMPGTGSCGRAAGKVLCRLLAFRHGELLIDEDVLLPGCRGSGAEPIISALLPADLKPGLLHIALLPGLKPSGFDAPHGGGSAVVAAPAAQSGAPLLLQPLLVLPQAAAADLHRYWQHAASAATSAEAAAAAKAAAWQAAVVGLTVDIGYCLTRPVQPPYLVQVARDPAAGFEDKQMQQEQTNAICGDSIFAGPVLVFKALVRHLAACKMLHLLTFLVQHMEGLAAAPGAVCSTQAEPVAGDSSDDSQEGCTGSGKDSKRSGPWGGRNAAPAAAAAAGNTNDSADSSGADSSSADSSNAGSGNEDKVVSTSCGTASNAFIGSQECAVDEAFMSTVGAVTGAEPKSVDAALQTVSNASVALMNHQKEYREIRGTGSSIHSHCSLKPVTIMELLFGFSNHVMELSYLGYCFVNSDVLDSLSAAFNFAMGFGCWFATAPKGGSLAASAAATSGTALKVAAASPLPPVPVSQVMLLWSYAMVLCCNFAVPAAVVVLRKHVKHALLAQGACSQQQLYSAAANNSSRGCSETAAVDSNVQQLGSLPVSAITWTASASSQVLSAFKEQGLQSCSTSHVPAPPTLPAPAAQLLNPAAAADLTLVVYAKAGQIRQRLLLVWMLLVILVLQLCARRHVVVPTMMVKVWSQLGWSQNMSAALALSLKAWMYQVPFLLFVPLITAEIASHVLCAMSHKMPPELIAVRFGPALLLAFAVSALCNIYSRWRFCLRRSAVPTMC